MDELKQIVAILSKIIISARKIIEFKNELIIKLTISFPHLHISTIPQFQIVKIKV